MKKQTQTLSQCFFVTHRKKTVVALVFITLFALCKVTKFVINDVVFTLPKTDELSLVGRRSIVRYTSGDGKMFLVTYGNDNVQNKEDMQLSGYDTAIIVNTGRIGILPNGSAIYAVDSGDKLTYLIKMYEHGHVSEIGRVPQCSDDSPYDEAGHPRYVPTGDCFSPAGYNPIKSYMAQIEGLSIATSSLDKVFVLRREVKITQPAAECTSWFCFTPDIFYHYVSYVHNVLIVKKNGTSHKVYEFDELAYPKPRKFIRVAGFSADKSLAIVEIGLSGDGDYNPDIHTYAYDIAHDKWALLTDNPNERVLALR